MAVIFLGIILFLVAILSFVFYLQLLKLNRNANSSLSEIEENLSLRAELIGSLSNQIKQQIDDSDEIIEDLINSKKEMLYASTVQDLSLGDKHFIESFFDLMANKKLKSELFSNHEFRESTKKLLSYEKNLQRARKQYDSDIRLVNKKLESFPIKYFNKIFKSFDPRPLYDFGYQERTKVKKLLKLNYE